MCCFFGGDMEPKMALLGCQEMAWQAVHKHAHRGVAARCCALTQHTQQPCCALTQHHQQPCYALTQHHQQPHEGGHQPILAGVQVHGALQHQREDGCIHRGCKACGQLGGQQPRHCRRQAHLHTWERECVGVGVGVRAWYLRRGTVGGALRSAPIWHA